MTGSVTISVIVETARVVAVALNDSVTVVVTSVEAVTVENIGTVVVVVLNSVTVVATSVEVVTVDMIVVEMLSGCGWFAVMVTVTAWVTVTGATVKVLCSGHGGPLAAMQKDWFAGRAPQGRDTDGFYAFNLVNTASRPTQQKPDPPTRGNPPSRAQTPPQYAHMSMNHHYQATSRSIWWYFRRREIWG